MRRHVIAFLALASTLAVGLPVQVSAQRRPDRVERPPAAARPPARRQQMERQLRQRLWQVTKERVGLTDAQMTKLGETTRRFDARRRAINQQERSERTVLRQQILAGDRADQQRVAAALDRMQQLQRQRVDLQAEEQRELAAYMTPIQRARFAALQEQVRRRVEALRRQRPDSSSLPAER
jgi:Spy/CpxP family protein refolding chaperone